MKILSYAIREEYFVCCAITIGIAVGRPELNLTPNHIGAEEFEAMKQ